MANYVRTRVLRDAMIIIVFFFLPILLGVIALTPTDKQYVDVLMVDYCQTMLDEDDCQLYTAWVNDKADSVLVNCVMFYGGRRDALLIRGDIVHIFGGGAEMKRALLTCLTQYSATLTDYLDTQ